MDLLLVKGGAFPSLINKKERYLTVEIEIDKIYSKA